MAVDLKKVKEEELRRQGKRDEAFNSDTYDKLKDRDRSWTKPKPDRITKADMINVVTGLTPDQVLKVALWCLLLMDTTDLRATLIADHTIACNESNKGWKTKINKCINVLDMSAKHSDKPRKDMLNALFDEPGWEKVPSGNASASGSSETSGLRNELWTGRHRTR